MIEREAPGIEPDQTVGAEQMAMSILFAKLSDGTIDINDLACNASFLTPAMSARHIGQECHWVALEGFGYSDSYVSETHYTETFYGFDFMIMEGF